MSTNLPIASLDTTAIPPLDHFIRGIVTLLWPYSSSTRQCAFLLADPDFRLRSKRGQVRVRFIGASAQAVAERRVGIGDQVVLELRGARWEEDRERGRTPGKSVEGELVFGGRVGLEIRRARGEEGEGERVEVEGVHEDIRTDGQVNGATEAHTPAPVASRRSSDLLRTSPDGSFLNRGGDGHGNAAWTYSSPAFTKKLRLSDAESSFVEAAYDPFVDDLSEETGKRTSFGTGLRWRLKSRTPSPVKERFREGEGEAVSPLRGTGPKSMADAELESDEAEAVDLEETHHAEGVKSPVLQDSLNTATSVATSALQATNSPSPSPSNRPIKSMPPPPSLPRLRMPFVERTESANQHHQPTAEEPSTPILEPVHSPTLPLPSPFPADTPPAFLSGARSLAPPPYKANSLFGALGNAASVIERRRVSGRQSQEQLQPAPAASLPPPRVALAPVPPAESVVVVPDPAQPDVTAPIVMETVDLAEDRDDDDDDDHVQMSDLTAPAVQETDIDQSFSTTIADDEMYEDYERSLQPTLYKDGVILPDVDDGIVEIDDEIVDGVHSSTDREDSQQMIETTKGHDAVIVTTGQAAGAVDASASPIATARAKSGSPTKAKPDEFSLDGASFSTFSLRRSPRKRQPSNPAEDLQAPQPTLPATELVQDTAERAVAAAQPTSAQVTPQSQKDRARKSTYRSLFGLRSPSKDPVTVVELDRRDERFIPGWFFEMQGQGEVGADVGEGDVGGGDVVAADVDDDGDGGVTMIDVNAEGRTIDVDARSTAENFPPTEDVNMAEEEPAPAENMDMAEQEPSPDLTESQRLASGLGIKQQSSAPAQPSRVQVIDFDASSDIEDAEGQEQGDDTPKNAVPELSSSSAVIQDSLETSQGETFAVPEDERLLRRRGERSAVPEMKQVEKTGAPTKLALAADMMAREDAAMVSSPTPSPADLPLFEHDVEEHVAPPRSKTKSTAPDVPYSSESERFSSSPTLPPFRLSQASFHPTTQTPSYPTLPLSPSNSQSLQGMQSQPVIEESVRGRLPPTPQLTQRESSIRAEERLSQRTPASKTLLRSESSLRAEAKVAESPLTPQVKTPSRRSARLRTSNVPDVLSEWFSPRTSAVSRGVSKADNLGIGEDTLILEANDLDAVKTNGHELSSNGMVTLRPSTGFATAHSFFTPLSKLPALTNPSSQQSYGTSALDLLALVTDKTAEPVRAKTGPRDYFTVLRIADNSIAAGDNISVEVFRPYKNTLPAAEVGDVVLLRGFVVKSKKRTPYLLSTDASAWCVWRYPDARQTRKPAWARSRRAGSAAAGVVEEMKGPPVEFGDEERAHAKDLREWWVASVGVDGMTGEGNVGGKLVGDVVAKL